MTLEPGGFLSSVTAVCTESYGVCECCCAYGRCPEAKVFFPTVAKSYRVHFLVELYLKTIFYSKKYGIISGKMFCAEEAVL